MDFTDFLDFFGFPGFLFWVVVLVLKDETFEGQGFASGVDEQVDFQTCAPCASSIEPRRIKYAGCSEIYAAKAIQASDLKCRPTDVAR